MDFLLLVDLGLLGLACENRHLSPRVHLFCKKCSHILMGAVVVVVEEEEGEEVLGLAWENRHLSPRVHLFCKKCSHILIGRVEAAAAGAGVAVLLLLVALACENRHLSPRVHLLSR